MAIHHLGDSTTGDDLPNMPPYSRYRTTLIGTATWDPSSISAGGYASTTLNVTDAVVGSPVAVGFSKAVVGTLFTAQVTASEVVTVTAFNATGSPVDLASGTLSVLIFLI